MNRVKAATLVGLSVVLAGCPKPAPMVQARGGADRARPPEVFPQGFGVLSSEAAVQLSPSPGPAVTRLRHFGSSPEPWPDPGVAVRVLGEVDGYIEVGPVLRHPERHCQTTLFGDAFDVSWYVSPWALAEVVRRDVERSFEDGTEVWVGAGVPLRLVPIMHSNYAVATGGVRFVLGIADSDVGHSYEAPPEYRALPNTRWVLEPRTRFTIDDGEPLQVQLPRGGDGNGPRVLGAETTEGGIAVSIGSRCVTARVYSDRVPEPFHAPEPVGLDINGEADFGSAFAVGDDEPITLLGSDEEVALEDPAEVGGEVGFEPPREPPLPVGAPPFFPVVEQGAAIYFDGTGPARGVLRDARVLSDPSFIAGGRVCFTTSLSRYFDPPLPMCFDAAEVRVSTPESQPFDGPGGRVVPLRLEVPESLDEAAVAVALRRARHELRTCYGRSLFNRTIHQHQLSLTLDIDGDGNVTDVVGYMDPRRFGLDCYTEAARGWRLPAPADGRPARVQMRVDMTLRPWSED